MKKYIRLIVVLLFTCSLISCDDFLETSSKSTFLESSVFTNYDFADKMVKGIYLHFTSQNMYDYRLGLFFKCDNDIEWAYGTNDNAQRSLAHYAGTSASTGLNSVWNKCYQAIEQANICIDNLPQSPVWKEGDFTNDARRLYGEAVTLRALIYYELIMIWGDIPFSVKSTQAGDDFYLPKTDRDSIYEYLIQNLKEVEDFVPWMSETQTTERVSKGFVKGLRARMALSYAGYSLRNKTFETRRGRDWQQYYQIANQECREIIESGKHQLNPNFQNVFKILHSYGMDLTYRESMFEIAFGRLQSGRVAETIGMAHVTSPQDPKYGRAASAIKLFPTYFYSFDKQDIRRNVSVEMYNYGNASYLGQQRIIGTANFEPCKWRRSWITPSMGGDLKSISFTGVNWPLMRYSDILLMYAETENEINNGPTSEAKNALRLVRERAFPAELWSARVVHYIDSVSSGKESFFDAIVNERAWELGGEMIRKQDLVRWNLLGAKLKKAKEDATKIINNDPEFAHVPDYIYWKYIDDNETLDILNQDYRIPAQVEGYSRTGWLPILSGTSRTNFETNVINQIANGYDETKNNHLYPIQADIINASNGILENDQIP